MISIASAIATAAAGKIVEEAFDAVLLEEFVCVIEEAVTCVACYSGGT